MGVLWNASGTLTINRPGQVAVEGSDQAGGSSDAGVSCAGTSAVLVVNGHVLGGSNGVNDHGIQVPSTVNAITVNGDVAGGGGSTNVGINLGANAVSQPNNVTGTIKGGAGSGSHGISLSGSQHVTSQHH